ncbi:hypothetical protein [Dyella telluris]|uniref:Uncharacterized protein n=1 Tax=Dyella telluris TaxID=2763498 RepID=A0A7G8Q3P1_9GAMM|nr:hypothetical protein [Dyella telluris]QNK01399.1 hypothetical protein H8F01_20560 [Dyella telluris]
MTSVSPEAVDVRLTQLERSLRRTRWGMVGLLVLVVAMFLAWYGVGGITQREIRAHRIYAVDDTGTVRVRVGEDPPGGNRKSRVAGLVVYDTTGIERGGLATMANGSVALGLDAQHSEKGVPRDRMGMMVDGKGGTMFILEDGQGSPIVMAKGAAASGGSLQVSEATPDGKQLQVRTLGVHGDTQSTESGE